MNQNDQTDDYNVVIDTLQKKLDALAKIQRECDNLNSSFGGGIGMMDSIRYEQIDELSKAIKREKAIAHVNETPKTEHVKADVLNKTGNVVFDDDTVWQLAQKVRSDLDRKSCPGVYMDLAMESIVKHAKQALAAEPAPSIADGGQNWAGMDGSTAFQLIERHADGWADIGKMMHEWLAANTPKPDPELADAHRTLAKWLNEEIEAPIDRVSLAKVLAATCLVWEVAELVGAMEETQRDLTLLLGNIYASAKRDKNWEGMYDVVNGWITRNHRALENYEKGAPVKKCVAAQPKKLVRLTDEAVFDAYMRSDLDVDVKVADLCSFAGEIMDAMERKNGGVA